METLKIGNVWHRRFIEFAGQADRLYWLDRTYDLDTCSYRGVFIRSMIVVFLTLFASMVVGVTFGYDLAVFSYHAYLGQILTPDELIGLLKDEFPPAVGMLMAIVSGVIVIAAILLVVLLAAALIDFVCDFLKELMPNKKKKKTPSSTAVLISSWKEKFCRKIELED